MISLIQTVAVAEYLSFHRAAKALGISQSSVSTRIKALEQTLGVVLFERNTRGVRLTEAGRRFVDQIEDAVGILDHAVKTANMRACGKEGELRIGVHALVPGGFLDRLLRQFHAAHSLVHLDVCEGTARESQIMVRDGRLDIAFMACIHDVPDLNSRVIWRDQLRVALAATHPLAADENVCWKQLLEETFLVRQEGVGPQLIDLILLRAISTEASPIIRRLGLSHGALISMIAAGHGISICAEEECEIAPVGVAFLPITDEPEPTPYSVVWSPSNRCPLLKELLALAAAMGRSSR